MALVTNGLLSCGCPRDGRPEHGCEFCEDVRCEQHRKRPHDCPVCPLHGGAARIPDTRGDDEVSKSMWGRFKTYDSPADDSAVRAVAARLLVEHDCAEGRHRTETDSDTGDEVCRFCGEVVEP
jgi:hypothetical protein